jgi:hypothetical protein
MTTRTGLPGQGNEEKTARIIQPGKDRKRRGQAEKDWTARKGQAEEECHDRTSIIGRPGQYCKDRTARYGCQQRIPT